MKLYKKILIVILYIIYYVSCVALSLAILFELYVEIVGVGDTARLLEKYNIPITYNQIIVFEVISIVIIIVISIIIKKVKAQKTNRSSKVSGKTEK